MNATYREISLITDYPVSKYKEFLWEATFSDGEILRFITSGQSIPDIRKSGSHSLGYVYDIALQDCKNKVVLDVGCGCGCGSARLAEDANSVLGIEKKEDIALYGNKRYGNKRCVIKQGDILDLEYENQFDVIVCCDVIEHIKDYKKALKNVYRAVKSLGVVIITTPDRELRKNNNPYHAFEWNLAEFKENISWMGVTNVTKPSKNRTMLARIVVNKLF